MARYRQSKKSFNQTSRKSSQTFRLRIILCGQEFDAEGAEETVIQQYANFFDFVKNKWLDLKNSFHSPIGSEELSKNHHDLKSSSSKPHSSLSNLDHLFQNDPHSSSLILTFPLPEHLKEASTILLLLLGYRELRAITDVSVIVLKQSLKHSQWSVSRLDRILKNYSKDRFVMKIGRGKGGKYRLTHLGIQKAREKMLELRPLFQN